MQALQAVWLKRLLCGEFSLPPRVEMERAVETEQAAISIGIGEVISALVVLWWYLRW